MECRGNRVNLPLCNCTDTYYDDGVHDICQKCVAPCINCSSATFCLSCPFNKSPPNCECSRNPPPSIVSDWCTTCEVAFPTIRFDDTLT